MVRAGLEILARVRDGESLSEILGTELETRLRADATHWPRTFLEPLRTSYPMPSSPIVDGLAAILAWRASPTSPHFPAAVLSDIAQLLDSAADLLTAESVFQLVSGNAMGAAAGLDALGQGARPPEPAVARGPAGGIGVSHRVAVLDDTPALVGRRRRRRAPPHAATSMGGWDNFWEIRSEPSAESPPSPAFR